MNVQHVLCVCTGNICRSPLAEGLLRRDAPSITASSAGIGAVVGAGMPEAAARIAERESLEILDHRGRQVTSTLLRENDVVIVMESMQKRWITSRFPESNGRVFMASHWRDGEDIADPFRKSDSYFEQVYNEIVSCMADWTSRLAPHTANPMRY